MVPATAALVAAMSPQVTAMLKTRFIRSPVSSLFGMAPGSLAGEFRLPLQLQIPYPRQKTQFNQPLRDCETRGLAEYVNLSGIRAVLHPTKEPLDVASNLVHLNIDAGSDT